MHALLAAAPPDHREAFRRAVVAEVKAEADQARRNAKASDTSKRTGDLSVPDLLDRRKGDA
jgi:hypothetical protein